MKNVEMKVAKFNFAGAELAVIIGHPKHELLFVASQVANAAGIKSQAAIPNAAKRHGGLKIKDLVGFVLRDRGCLVDNMGRALRPEAYLLPEDTTYLMLLRGHAPQSEPFRKWVTEEVLPSIRKTGSYDLAKSNTPEAKQVSEDFSAMRAALDGLTAEVKSLKTLIEELKAQGPSAPVVDSVYNGQRAEPVHMVFDKAEFKRQCEVAGLSQGIAIKLIPRAVVAAEAELITLWDKIDGRALNKTVSQQGRHWKMFPENFLKQNLTTTFYRSLALRTLEQAL